MNSGGDAAQAPERSIEALSEDEQRLLILEVTSYASFLMRTQARWLPRGALPRGYDPETLALEAITRVLDGRRRDWNPEKEPTLTDYLKSVVKSIFSSELLPAAKRELAEVSAIDAHGTDRTTNVESQDPSADELLTTDQLKERILESFELEEDQLVLLCLFDNITEPAAIEDQTGLQRREIYRIKQKIQRRLVGLRDEG